MSHNHEDISNMVEELMDADDKLSSWEWDFVNDMSSKIVAGESFSAKQAETIVKIWERRT
jgi:hypothetical protein